MRFHPQMEGAFAIDGQNCLLQCEKQMAQAALARAISSKDDGKRGKLDWSGVFPGLKVFDAK